LAFPCLVSKASVCLRSSRFPNTPYCTALPFEDTLFRCCDHAASCATTPLMEFLKEHPFIDKPVCVGTQGTLGLMVCHTMNMHHSCRSSRLQRFPRRQVAGLLHPAADREVRLVLRQHRDIRRLLTRPTGTHPSEAFPPSRSMAVTHRQTDGTPSTHPSHC
jgi:hypothetical protein